MIAGPNNRRRVNSLGIQPESHAHDFSHSEGEHRLDITTTASYVCRPRSHGRVATLPTLDFDLKGNASPWEFSLVFRLWCGSGNRGLSTRLLSLHFLSPRTWLSPYHF